MVPRSTETVSGHNTYSDGKWKTMKKRHIPGKLINKVKSMYVVDSILLRFGTCRYNMHIIAMV